MLNNIVWHTLICFWMHLQPCGTLAALMRLRFPPCTDGVVLLLSHTRLFFFFLQSVFQRHKSSRKSIWKPIRPATKTMTVKYRRSCKGICKALRRPSSLGGADERRWPHTERTAREVKDSSREKSKPVFGLWQADSNSPGRQSLLIKLLWSILKKRMT